MLNWKEAQKHEKRYWSELERKKIKIPKESLDRFSKILGLLEVNKFKNRAILDIGSGPKGGIFAVVPRSKMKVAVDPLLETSLTELASDIDPVVAVAERLPIRDNSFDLVFCINALDHMAEPYKALNEIFRVTRKEFVLMVHVVPPKRKALHTLLHLMRTEKLILSQLCKVPKPLLYIVYLCVFRVFKLLYNEQFSVLVQDGNAHPHYFTSSDIINRVAKTGFLIRVLETMPDITYGVFKLNLCVIAEK